MVQLTVTLLILAACVPSASAQVSKYANWKPDAIRVCETVQHPTNLALGGVSCGYSSYNMMHLTFDVEITSTTSLGLINVGWITSEALRGQAGFWKTCKSYMVRVFDGIYKNSATACALLVNPPSGLPNCTDNMANLNYRSGSGYCMKSKVCGASVPIDFYKSADNTGKFIIAEIIIFKLFSSFVLLDTYRC
ncbi:unnamed protein product [Caenorhabditis brenneri]